MKLSEESKRILKQSLKDTAMLLSTVLNTKEDMTIESAKDKDRLIFIFKKKLKLKDLSEGQKDNAWTLMHSISCFVTNICGASDYELLKLGNPDSFELGFFCIAPNLKENNPFKDWVLHNN